MKRYSAHPRKWVLSRAHVYAALRRSGQFKTATGAEIRREILAGVDDRGQRHGRYYANVAGHLNDIGQDVIHDSMYYPSRERVVEQARGFWRSSYWGRRDIPVPAFRAVHRFCDDDVTEIAANLPYRCPKCGCRENPFRYHRYGERRFRVSYDEDEKEFDYCIRCARRKYDETMRLHSSNASFAWVLADGDIVFPEERLPYDDIAGSVEIVLSKRNEWFAEKQFGARTINPHSKLAWCDDCQRCAPAAKIKERYGYITIRRRTHAMWPRLCGHCARIWRETLRAIEQCDELIRTIERRKDPNYGRSPAIEQHKRPPEEVGATV